MKSQTNKFLIAIIGIQFLLCSSFLYAADEKLQAPANKSDRFCLQAKKNEFKVLYLKLQQSLNYEGKDVEFTDPKTGTFKLVDHEKDKEYGGVSFEKRLYSEYQNTLRKVGAIYQAARPDATNSPAKFQSNKALIDFIAAVDSKDTSKYIAETNIDDVIDQLKEASKEKNPENSKFRISAQDEYLLRKLLTHSQDVFCSIREYTKTKKDTYYFSAEVMNQKKNAPLNQLLLALKDAKIEKDTDIQIVDTEVVINSAIQENINALSKWMNEASHGCKAAVASNAFMNSIQVGIQPCNYGEFIKSLEAANTTDIEKILHFINANEKFLKKVTPKAETDLKENKLQSYIDSAFLHVGKKIHCTEIFNTNRDKKRLFVRNLPYFEAEDKFDTSKITCKEKVLDPITKSVSERTLDVTECTSKIELVVDSDNFGRGVEVKQKNPKGSPISFSIKENSECNDIPIVVPQADEVKANPVGVTPTQIPASNKLEMCQAAAIQHSFPGIGTLLTDGTCKNVATEDGCKALKPVGQIPNSEKTACIPGPVVPEVKPEIIKKTKADCDKENKNLDEAKNECVPRKKEESLVGSEESPEVKICRENNKKLSDDNQDRPFEDWKIINGKCVNTKDKPSKSRDTTEEEVEKPDRAPEKFTAPPRFIPVNIPTRQMYILPGMP